MFCGLYKLPNCCEENEDSEVITDYLMPAASPGSSALNFLVRVALKGMLAHALAYTGAGLSFVSSSFVAKHGFKTDNLEGDECFNVRLGNGTTVPVWIPEFPDPRRTNIAAIGRKRPPPQAFAQSTVA